MTSHHPTTSLDHQAALRVAEQANQSAYLAALRGQSREGAWDYLILTAANQPQASGYQAELDARARVIGSGGAFFPARQRHLVVPDPPGRRAGSGGATFGAIRSLVRQFDLSSDALSRARVLLIHSGGASQRLPMYSPVGKLFAPLAMQRPDSQVSTLFDHLYITLAGLAPRLGPGLLIVSGDVLMIFDHRRISAPKHRVTALSMPVDPELGTAHGVFVAAPDGRITRSLQKVSVDAMKQANAIDTAGRVLLDTGLLFFDPNATQSLATLAGVAPPEGKSKRTARAAHHKGLDEKTETSIDLYDELCAALSPDTDRRAFLRSGHPVVRRTLLKELNSLTFGLQILDGEFLHLGTTRQFRDAMTGIDRSPAAVALFHRDIHAHIEWNRADNARIYASSLAQRDSAVGQVGEHALIEHSLLTRGCSIGRRAVVSQVTSDESFALPDDTVLFQVPIRSSGHANSTETTVSVHCGTSDDFKGLFHEGKCLFLNTPIDVWLRRHKIQPDAIWQGQQNDRRTLWNARLFPISGSKPSLMDVLWFSQPRAVTANLRTRWLRSTRLSMADILEQADRYAIIRHRERLAAVLAARQLIHEVQADLPAGVSPIVQRFADPSSLDAARSELLIAASTHSTDPRTLLRQARLLASSAKLADAIGKHALADEAEVAATQRVATASEIAYRSQQPEAKHAELKHGLIVRVDAPVRLDLAGGWTDTPPYCYDAGGDVVNVAIDLDDAPPVRVVARTIDEPVIRLISHDLGTKITLDQRNSRSDSNSHQRFAHAFGLHEVVLEMAGLLPHRGSIRSHLKHLGAGVELESECRVPKGSGLGTSSILGGAMIAAVMRLRGTEMRHDDLVEATLLAEQRLGTGGGWQDQAGGLFGGVKRVTSGATFPQRPGTTPIAMSRDLLSEFESRLVVYFTGQQRLARDILQRVVGRWLARDPSMLQTMRDLHDNARNITRALSKGRWSSVGEEISRYWRLKRDIWPASTTPATDILFEETRGLWSGASLAGAGGGGFAYFFCNTRARADRLRQHLAARSLRPGEMGSLYQARINRDGLRLSIQRASR